LIVRALAILAIGTTLGLASALAAVWHLGGHGAVRVGPWVTPLDAGGPNRGPYLRAAAALRATLALSRQEAIYFRAATDSDGQTLNGACTYLVHGPDLPARWWSITLYGTDHYLIANPENRFSYASPNAAHAPDGTVTVHLAPTKQPGNWLDTAAAKNFILLTRLYQPHAQAAADPARIPLPTITRQTCP
jgi:hypothetical protein